MRASKYIGRIAVLTAVFVLSGMTCGCKSDKKDDVSGKERPIASSKVPSSVKPPVKTMKLEESEITHDIVSNGKIAACESADLYFRSSEPVSELWVKEGQRVKRGQQLARLDLFKLESERTKLISTRDRARLEMQDVLIGQGYDPSRISEIPDDVVRLACVRSGLDEAESSLSSNAKEIEHATLRAPFNGVVANLKVMRHGMSNPSEAALRIINDGVMSVEFPVLESELPLLKTGDVVEVSIFAGGEVYKGKISEINPTVDDKGLVKIRASLSSHSGLVDGMNARVRVTKNLGKRLVVPKSAVVQRSGRDVVFTLENGKAIWNYVTVGIENLDSREITEGLTAGQTVIIEGNENLAHQAPVAE